MDRITNNRRGDIATPLRALFVLGAVALLLYLLRYVAMVLLTAFAGVLLAVLLDAGVRAAEQRLSMRRSWALTIEVLLILGILAVAAWSGGPQLVNQALDLIERLPEALEQIRSYLSSFDWGRRLLQAIPEQLMMFGADGGLLGQITGAASWAVGFATTTIVIVVVGLLTAYRPGFYRAGLLLLVPPGRRGRAGYVLDTVGRALRLWLLARFLSMLVVGVLTGVGLLIAGVPLALTLGLIAGLLSFIPYLGPILSVVPALLITLGAAPGKAPWVVLVYVVVQLVESNLITPLIEQETTSVPAPLLIVLQVLFASLAGLLGVFLAAPLTVTATALVQLLYVQDILHERIQASGESRKRARFARGSVHREDPGAAS